MSDAAPTRATSFPTIGSPAPDFEANSTHGPISLRSFEGKWVLLFSHPYDFTPVCSTEFLGFSRRAADFAERNTQLVGLSVDSVYSHIAWTRNLEKQAGIRIGFPVIADLDQRVARAYGMIHEGASDMATVRALFFIDPKRVVRASIYYPMNAGRSVDEVVRLLDALQTVDKNADTACPEGWKRGDHVIFPPPKTADAAEARMKEHASNPEAKDWFFVKRPL